MFDLDAFRHSVTKTAGARKTGRWMFLLPLAVLAFFERRSLERQRLIAAGYCSSCLMEKAEAGYDTCDGCHAIGV